MEPNEIRTLNARYLAELHGRESLAKKLGYDDCNYLNQLCTGHGSFGRRTAKKFEEALGLGERWMETPHPGLWSDDPDTRLRHLDSTIKGLTETEISYLLSLISKAIGPKGN